MKDDMPGRIYVNGVFSATDSEMTESTDNPAAFVEENALEIHFERWGLVALDRASFSVTRPALTMLNSAC